MLVAPALLLPALAACGSDDGEEAGAGLAAVTISGDLGTTPEVEWGEDYTAAAEPETETLVTGEGPEIEAGATALVHYWIGNGFDQSEAISTYTAQPELLDLSSSELPEALTAPVAGATVGSRIATSLSAEEIFGEVGQPAFGISNQDPLLLVIDVLGPYDVDVPYSEEGQAWAPDLVLDEDGQPEAMRFMGIPRPSGRLQVQTVVEGAGETVEEGDFIMVDYLGSVYAKPNPFDGSFDGQPLVARLVEGGLVDGWVQGLAGKTVGSRVWLQIPPRFGYGAEGNEGAGIKGTDTIYFLVDILGRAPEPSEPEPGEDEQSGAPEASPSTAPSVEPNPSESPSPAVSPTDEES